MLYERNANRHFKDLEGVIAQLAAGTGAAVNHQRKGSPHERQGSATGVKRVGSTAATKGSTVERKGSATERKGADQAAAQWDIDVIYHSDDMHPCLLHLALREADIFLTTHGFQALALLFLKRGAVLVEIFPYKYFKQSYQKLSGAYGVHHRWRQNTAPTSLSRLSLMAVSQEQCMRVRRCRSHARGDSVAVTGADVEFVLNITREVEAGRLGAHNAPRHPRRAAAMGKKKTPATSSRQQQAAAGSSRQQQAAAGSSRQQQAADSRHQEAAADSSHQQAAASAL